MLSAFGDESSDETKSRVFAVAALLGDSSTWSEFRDRWRVRLGNAVFHAADCESGYGDFRGMGETERHKLHADLTTILADSKLMGYGAAIELAGIRELAPTVIANFPDMPCYDCFIKAVIYMADLAAVFVPPEKLEFTFDQHRETQYNAGLLYDWLTEHKAEIVEKVSFGTR